MFYYYKQNEMHITILNQVAVGYSPPPDFTCLSDSITYTDCTKYECDSLALEPQQITPTQFLGADYLEENFRKSTILPNPVTDDFELSFISEELGSINLIISDNLGNTIENIEFNKESYEFILPLSSEELITGSYFYKLIKDGELIGEGAFTVVK